jgi:DNA-binding beta-propeller fold protein YncE
VTIAPGANTLIYEPVENWAKLPEGWSFLELAGVAVDSQDNVYALTRGEHPVIVFDRDGNFLRAWGEGLFGRTHGIHIGPDDSVYIADDGKHTVRKFTPEGKLLLTLGDESKPAAKWSGEPFNRPTHVAVSPVTGDLYITDGYGNSRVHSFTADGRYRFSWGSPGIDPGQFQRPHNIVIDKDDNIYVADRENHRIQVFNNRGELQAIWQNIYRPDGICLGADGILYVGELCAFDGLEDGPGFGHRVSIYDLQGNRLALYGDPIWGDGPGQFIAPHGIAVDSRGDIYVAEASYTMKGSRLNPPRELRSFQKLRRKV